MRTEEERRDHIAALLRERAQAVSVGDHERVKAIDEQLRIYGHEAKAPARRAVRR